MTEIAPIFDPEAWTLTDEQAALCTRARDLAAEKGMLRAVN